MRPVLACCLLLLLSLANVTRLAAQQKTTPADGATRVEVTITTPSKPDTDESTLMQVALLLDTSNSMDGLIRQAQTQLWAIVNELASKTKDGVLPQLEVALFEYGNNGLPVTENYIRQIVPLTQDLDCLSEQLFALTTNGGSEYCGAVIDEAITVLNWEPGHGHYKAIFIAGNEPFTQGPVDYAETCARARAEGVIVNTIHCGAKQAGIAGKWRHGAKLGGGKYMTIDQDRAIAHIHCPQDDVLLKLNIKLNSTYIPYGVEGAQAVQRQRSQDKIAGEAAPQALMERIVSKSSSNAYRNSRWDIVDAFSDNEEIVDELAADQMPAGLRGKSKQEIRHFIVQQLERRQEIQAEIKKVSAARAGYLAQQRRQQDDEATLGTAVQDVIRQQVERRGYE